MLVRRELESFWSRVRRFFKRVWRWILVKLRIRNKHIPEDIDERGVQYAHYIDLKAGTHIVKKEQL
jgi:hypothetical protein